MAISSGSAANAAATRDRRVTKLEATPAARSIAPAAAFAASTTPVGNAVPARLRERRHLEIRDVEPERPGEPHALLEVVPQHLDVALAHQAGDRGACLRPPERVLDE